MRDSAQRRSAESSSVAGGMNRLRAAYVELDSGIDRFLVASRHDDEQGIGQTYSYFPHSSQLAQPLASSMMFIIVVDAVVAGVLAGLIANAAGGSGVAIALAAAIIGTSYLLASVGLSVRRFIAQERGYEALFPHPATQTEGTH